MYAVILHQAPFRGTDPPKHHLVFGVPAESFFRIGAPLLMGALSIAGLVYAVRGRNEIATTFALTGVLMSSLVAAGQAVAAEEAAGRL